VRVVIADDEALVRDGLARLLEDSEIEVAARCSDAPTLLRAVASYAPDAAIVDIRMPPSHTDEGLVAAAEIRARHPEVGVLVLSHHLESEYAVRLLDESPERAGYLLKDRVSDIALIVDALKRLQDGECVVDPTIVARLMARRRAAGPLDELTDREREVLHLIAEGRSNSGICEALFLSPKTVEGHIRQIFMKLNLADTPGQHRRVLAVLAFLRAP
jgi:DNA-binding NarL/FixJ family response regulator